MDSSDFSLSPFGRVFLGFSSFFLNRFLSLCVGIFLNIISIYQYKSYLKRKQSETERLEMSSVNNRLVISRELEQLDWRERNERNKKKNMLYMALTLCSISIFSGLAHVLGYVYFFFFRTFEGIITVAVVYFFINAFVPTVSIFIFYLFNKMFRFELKKTIKNCMNIRDKKNVAQNLK